MRGSRPPALAFPSRATHRGQEQYAHIQAVPRRRLGHPGAGWPRLGKRGPPITSVGHWKLKPLCNQDRTRRTVLEVSSSFLVATNLHYLKRRLLGAPTPRANCCWHQLPMRRQLRLHSRWETGWAALPGPAGSGDVMRLLRAPPWCRTCCTPSS